MLIFRCPYGNKSRLWAIHPYLYVSIYIKNNFVVWWVRAVAVFAIDFGDRNMNRLLWATPACELPICLSNAPPNKLLQKSKGIQPFNEKGWGTKWAWLLQPWAGACTRVSHPQVLFYTAPVFFGKALWDLPSCSVSCVCSAEPSPEISPCIKAWGVREGKEALPGSSHINYKSSECHLWHLEEGDFLVGG